MSAKQRLKLFLEHLHIGQAAFERRVGISNGYVNNLNGSIGSSVIGKIATAYPELNTSWLLTGEGEMIIMAKHTRSVAAPVIRYWPDARTASGTHIAFDKQNNGEFREMVMPGFGDCTDAIPLFGDSMHPRYKAGQILILKPWVESFIESGQIYLIVTRTNYCTVKYIKPCSSDHKKITCVSENSETYPPFDIPIDDICSLYLVKGAIEQNAF